MAGLCCSAVHALNSCVLNAYTYRSLHPAVKIIWAVHIWFLSFPRLMGRLDLALSGRENSLAVKMGSLINYSQWRENRNDKCHFSAKAFWSWHATSKLFSFGDSHRLRWQSPKMAVLNLWIATQEPHGEQLPWGVTQCIVDFKGERKEPSLC